MGYEIGLDSSRNSDWSNLPFSMDELEILKKIEKTDIRTGLPLCNLNLPIMAIAKTLVNYLAMQTDLPVRLKSFELLSQIIQSADRKD